MRKILTLTLLMYYSFVIAQKNVNIPLANDFKIISSKNDTLHLYKTLAEGKTVILDFFQVTCSACVINIPVIDSAFSLLVNGLQNVVFWGISNKDSNKILEQFIDNYNVKFPCAGVEGFGDSVVNIFTSQMGVFGFPTYAVICPYDQTMHWQVNNPPNSTGFNQYINICNSTNIIKKQVKGKEIVQVYPNPAKKYINIRLFNDESALYRIDILSNMGEVLKTNTFQSINQDDKLFKINLDNLKERNYYITIYQDGNLIYAGMLIKINEN